MTKRKSEILSAITERLVKQFSPSKIYLFGSYATGNPEPGSDIDLIVVSSFFAKGRHISHMQYLFRKASKISTLIEPIPATPSEVKKPDKRVFIGQILKTAKSYNFALK